MNQETLNLHFNKYLPKYLEILKRMVNINSFTANPAGVNQLARFTAGLFDHLGFQAEYIQSQNPDFGQHLVLIRKGTTSKTIGLITHLDTVFPPEEEIQNNFSWRQEGDRIYGPGTNDIKGGTLMILMIMEAFHYFVPSVLNSITWVILANAAEERWSNDFGSLCRTNLGSDAVAALVFEAGYLEDNQVSLVTARKGMAVFEIHVEGKSAHAGNNHQTGANAILQMADIIQRISNLTDYEQDLTFNVGVLKGGTVPNRIPHFAEARGEMRSFSKDVFKQGVSNLLELNHISPIKSWDGNYTCNIDIQVVLENHPWPANPETEKLFDHWRTTAKNMGLVMIREERGGLSDGNQLWDFVPTIDGLGPNGRNAHCSESSTDGTKEQEYVTLSSFIPKAILNTLAIQNLIKLGSY